MKMRSGLIMATIAVLPLLGSSVAIGQIRMQPFNDVLQEERVINQMSNALERARLASEIGKELQSHKAMGVTMDAAGGVRLNDKSEKEAEEKQLVETVQNGTEAADQEPAPKPVVAYKGYQGDGASLAVNGIESDYYIDEEIAKGWFIEAITPDYVTLSGPRSQLWRVEFKW